MNNSLKHFHLKDSSQGRTKVYIATNIYAMLAKNEKN